MPSVLLDLLYIPAAVAYLPVLLYQMIVQKKNRRGWGQRFGFIRRRVTRRPCIWIHAVSLGEVNATAGLVAQIEKRLPAYDIAISATTDTGYAAARKRYTPKPVFRYPLDFSPCVRAVLNRIRPDAIILMELEVWPNLLRLARRRNIPVCVANGRITEARSMRRFRLPIIHRLARRMFGGLSWVAAQNEAYAERFVSLGTPRQRVFVTGSMKYDTAVIADHVAGDDRLAEAVGVDGDAPLLVAGSTGPGEEELLLAAFTELLAEHPDLQLAIIPRKPERFDDVARLIESRGFHCRRRSQSPDVPPSQHPAPRANEPRASARAVPPNQQPPPLAKEPRASARAAVPVASVPQGAAIPQDRNDGGDGEPPLSGRVVILGDTMGELRKFYALAAVVFVGRSLVPMGGSDLTEVAGLGRPMCFGPYVENFADVAQSLIAANAAVQLKDAPELIPTLRGLLADRQDAAAMGRRAQDVVRRNTGATRKTVDLLCESLGLRADHPPSSIATARLA